jgi:hypothetical protein
MARNARKYVFVLGVALSLGATRAAFAETCTYDTDCTELGTACGTDVCSGAVTPHTCVAASTHDPGGCQSTADCKCAPQGATCKGSSCTFTVLNEDEGGPYPLVPEEEAGASEGGVSEAGVLDAETPDATATQEAGSASGSGGGASPDASSSEVDAALARGSSAGGSDSSSGGCSAGASSGAGWGAALALLGGCTVLGRRPRERHGVTRPS